ncbi:hypothetical protein SARC_06907 [Sphaeroforma arctica JP610]|uniref:Uncharacterized protein n=1 Tax=Sphaeroforma arctica JP610 TaxID=667725 RepID=A0A0L0FVZ9_9EUKA|nr:hypothetical protein SARC_06907 [Sphaeroforma arctica JP610]KNC80736.1 hypothetical protein SARC_06907 [Sphaeroforma arctica JP610]|eukprot:XP_014154638.1 hypothetical protein SARC_06907 [Sphaeroforma arctica JP610]
MVPMLPADPVVIYPKEGIFLKHGRDVMPAPDFVTLVCHMSPYRPHNLRKDFWEKLEAERPVDERLAAAAVKREDEVVSCMVQEDTVGAVTHPSGMRVRCGLPAKEARVETTSISADPSGVLDQSVRKAEAQLGDDDKSQAGGSLRNMYTRSQSAKSPKLTRRQKDSAKIMEWTGVRSVP